MGTSAVSHRCRERFHPAIYGSRSTARRQLESSMPGAADQPHGPCSSWRSWWCTSGCARWPGSFKRIEDLQAGSAKVFVVAGDDGEVVPSGRSRNVAVFDRHAPARPLQLPLLVSPNVRDRSVEAENSSMQRSYKTSQPGLQRLPLLSLFTADPVGKLREDHRASVAAVLFSLEPSCHAWVAVALRGLTQDIGVQEPAHNLDRKYSRRRGGRSSMGTGQALSTFNQFGFDAMRRHIKASSSASKSTRKWSPGLAGTAAGTVNRRFESRVTIMVGYSHYRPTVSTCETLGAPPHTCLKRTSR